MHLPQNAKTDNLEEQQQRWQQPIDIEVRQVGGERFGGTCIPDIPFVPSVQGSTAHASRELTPFPIYGSDSFRGRCAPSKLLCERETAPHVPPTLPNQERDICIALLDREFQLERDIIARLRGENEQDLRIYRSRVAAREKERRALRLRAERAEEPVVSEQRALSQLRDECARLKQSDYSFHKLRVDLEILQLDSRSRETELRKMSQLLIKLEKEIKTLRPLRILLDAAQQTIAKQDRELDLPRPLIKEYQSAQNLIVAQPLGLGEQRQLREML